jgi:membrane associated rhomboid family serine protease
MLGSFGQTISRQFGKKVVWWLYLLGAFAGGLSMYFGMPHMGMVAPQTGAGPAISSLITFYGLFNLRNSVLLFFFPVKIWVNVSIIFSFCLVPWHYFHYYSHQKAI